MADTNSNLQIVVKVRDEATASLRQLSNDVSDLGGSLNFAGDKAGMLAGALAAIGAATVLKNAIAAFAESEAQMARFDAIMKTLPPNLQQFREQILAVADDALLKFGFGNEEAALSLARLMQATKDSGFSFQAFQAAMDLARFKGIGLEEATQALILAFQGNARLLKQFGIDVDEHASKQTILAAVTRTLAGQTEAYSKTLAGSLAVGKEIIGEFSEALGAVFAPAIKFAIDWIKKKIEAMGGMQAAIEKLRPVITWLATFLATAFVVSAGLAVAALGAMIGVSAGVIAAIVALASVVTLFIELWRNNWEQARAIFELFKINVSAIWQNMTNFMRSTFGSAIDWIRGQLQNILDFFNYVLNLVTTPIKSAASGIANTYNKVVGSVKSILGFAEGGIVTKPTLAMIGEGGESEAVIPLSRLGQYGGGGGVNVYLQGDFFTDKEAAERWGNEIAKVIKYQIRLSLT